jgi:hypothetical protein
MHCLQSLYSRPLEALWDWVSLATGSIKFVSQDQANVEPHNAA